MAQTPTDIVKVGRVLAQFDALRAERPGTSIAEAAKVLEVPRSTLNMWINQYGANPRAKAADAPRDWAAEIHVPKAPDPDEPIEDLIARKAARFGRDEVSREFHKLVPIQVKTPGPVVIVAVGDPHVDSDRCDIHRLVSDMKIIGRTPGMHALHLGDVTDNWVGRLGRLYAHSSTTAGDGIRLAEHMFKLAPPLAVVAGNHDLWNEGMSWLSFCLRQSGVDAKLLQTHGVRMELSFPKGAPIRIHARHDFPGHSQYNSVHGLMKEHLFGKRDHINIAGHRHIDAANASPSPEGYVHWAFRVSGYKAMDDFARQIGAQEKKMAPALGILINPLAKVQAEVVKPYWCLEAAADYLTFLRTRA